MTSRKAAPKAASIADNAAPAELLARIRGIWERLRAQAARSVNTAHVCANWLIGPQIVEAEQGGVQRAGYGQALLRNRATRLKAEFGVGFSLTALKHMRGLYQAYPQLLEKGHALRDLLDETVLPAGAVPKGHAARDPSSAEASSPAHAAFRPGILHTARAWTHYRALLKVARREARDFYEIEAVKTAWSARQLERQIASLLNHKVRVAARHVHDVFPYKAQKRFAATRA